MEKITIKTLIKEDHFLGKSEYVLGFINGLLKLSCDLNGLQKRNSDAMYYGGKGMVLTVETTENEYLFFKHLVENTYPKLCEFNYKD